MEAVRQFDLNQHSSPEGEFEDCRETITISPPRSKRRSRKQRGLRNRQRRSILPYPYYGGFTSDYYDSRTAFRVSRHELVSASVYIESTSVAKIAAMFHFTVLNCLTSPRSEPFVNERGDMLEYCTSSIDTQIPVDDLEKWQRHCV